MSSCTQCKTLVAKKPYLFPVTGQLLYSYEEFCYYLYQHPSFFSKDIINTELKHWLLDELDAKELVEKLNRLNREGTLERNYLLTLMTAYPYLPISSVQVILKEYDFLQEKGGWTKKKYYADDLFRVGCYHKAEKLYKELIEEIPNLPENSLWIGQIYYAMASCFARNMKYDEASRYYAGAYQLTNKKECKFHYWKCLYLLGELQAVKDDIKGNQDLFEDYAEFLQELEDETEGLFLQENYDIIDEMELNTSVIQDDKWKKIVSKWKQQFRKNSMYQYHMQ